MAYEIGSGVKRPDIGRQSNGEAKYPFAQMQVGDHFFVPSSDRGDVTPVKFRERVSNSAREYRKREDTAGRAGKKFTAILITDEVFASLDLPENTSVKVGDVGVWRDA